MPELKSLRLVLEDKTMDDKFITTLSENIQNYPLRRLSLVVEKFSTESYHRTGFIEGLKSF